jgi:phosphate transport system substrate-binding protein
MRNAVAMMKGFALSALFAVAACAGGDSGGAAGDYAGLAGTIDADGSSTVFPVTEAFAEDFGLATNGGVRVNVGQSGTGGGFKRFCAGETDISNASRPIQASEQEVCAQNGVEYVEFRVAIDGIAITVNPANDFADCLKVEELKRIWEPESTVKTWADVRAGWPAQPIRLYGPGTNSGTFDYFTEEVVGTARASRADYTASEDDNVLVQGVEGDPYALGYFGFAYYLENEAKLKALPVDGGNGCVAATPETIKTGTYSPLSRPLFIYVRKASLARPEVAAFIRFYLENAPTLVPQTGYVPLEAAEYQAGLAQLTQATGGN